jgi:integrase
MVRALRQAGELAPRTILNVYGLVHTMFRDALVDELIEDNPCMLHRGELPEKTDKDPEWRASATYTAREVEQLISDARIPVERRVQYALKAIAGLRHGEVAGLRWRHYDPTLEPLGRLVIATSYDTGRTKTEVTRRVPVHLTLAKILAAWKLSHWERIYGRAPTPDDLIVPTRNMTPTAPKEANEAFKHDLAALGLRIEAGEYRDRGGHDLRSWFITTCQEHGAHRDLLRVVTHTAKGDVVSGYTRATWGALCAEVAKLRVSTLDGELLPLATAELTAANRWRKVVTPLGLEVCI